MTDQLNKLREEITEVFDRPYGEEPYGVINRLEYLAQQVLKEAEALASRLAAAEKQRDEESAQIEYLMANQAIALHNAVQANYYGEEYREALWEVIGYLDPQVRTLMQDDLERAFLMTEERAKIAQAALQRIAALGGEEEK